MSSSTTQTTLNPQQLTNETLNTNSLHFILLSLLFLPFTVSATAAVQFYMISSSQTLLTIKTLITILTSTCLIILSTVAGIALITCSTNHAIHHKPLTFSSTLKSLMHADTRLLYTVIVRSIKLIILLLAVLLSLIAVTEAIKAALAYHFGLFFFPIFINLIVCYVLAITVFCEPTTVRLQSFSIVFRTGFAIVPALSYSSVLQNFRPTANWILVMQFGTVCLQSSLMILLHVVEITVLYVRCEVESGEEVEKTKMEEAVSGEYVRLAVNDTAGEVVHELAEEEANGGFNYMLYLLTIVWVIVLCVQFYYIYTSYKNV